MRRLTAAAASLAIVFASCGGERQTVDARQPAVVIESAGSVVEGDRVGAAALLRIRGDSSVGPIELRLSFVDRAGVVVGTTVESLPFCTPDTACWWAASFYVDDVGGRSVDGVSIKAIRSQTYQGEGTVDEVDLSRDQDASVRGRAAADEGIAYVISFVDGRPRRGESVNVTPESGRRIVIPRDLLPPVPGEELRAFFYPGPGGGGD